MTTTVYVTRGGRRWHSAPNCRALEAGQLIWDTDEGDGPHPVREVSDHLAVDLKRTPCRTCTAAPSA